jgi:ABC-2 type transport system ATP-binding protein
LGGVDAKKRIEELFDLTGLRGFEEVTFQHYSSGMARRLLLARALLVDVPILLFDEPTANLDPNNAVKFRDLMKSLTKSKGKTVLFATHNMFEAQELCDSIAIMDKGRVAAVGSPDEIRHLFGRKMKIVMGVRFPDEASESQLIDAVQDYPKVLGVSVRRNGAESSKLTIEAGIDLDINDLLRSILANDVVVQTLETSYPSLEDAFVALTAEDTK